jgi:hypothetical protein
MSIRFKTTLSLSGSKCQAMRKSSPQNGEFTKPGFVFKLDGPKLKEGEEYRLLIKKGILSTDGVTLAADFIGFFAISHSFSLDNVPLTGLTESRAVIMCISDLHLGDDRSFNIGYGWLNDNRSLLAGFLNKVRLSPNIKELVIAGDLFDEWFSHGRRPLKWKVAIGIPEFHCNIQPEHHRCHEQHHSGRVG